MEQWFIYALCEPDDGRERYVGFTSVSPKSRLSQHLSRARKTGRLLPVQIWLRRLMAKAQKPSIKILEVGDGEWKLREMYWIERMRFMHDDLLNLSDGGQKPVIPAASRKAAGEKLKTRYFSPEHRARISAAKTGKPRKDRDIIVARAMAMAAANKGKKMTISPGGMRSKQENGKRLSDGNSARWANLSQEQRAERSAKASAQMKRVWAGRKNGQ